MQFQLSFVVYMLYSHLYFVLDCQGTTSVQAIFFNRSEFEELELNDADFRSMSKLILLSVDFSKTGDYCKLKVSLHLPNSLRYLYWRGYPLKSLPLKFSPESLVELHMPNSHVQQLWKDDKVFILILVHV